METKRMEKNILIYKEQCDSYISSLSKKNVNILQKYQQFGGYRYFNEAIARNFSSTGDIKALKDTLIIDNILSNAPLLPPKLIVYRGLRNKGCYDLHNYKVGDLIYNKSLMSTSLSKNSSKNFIYPRSTDDKDFMKYMCFLTIEMPKNTRGIHGLYIENLPVGLVYKKTHEHEILFPTGLQLEIVSIDVDKKTGIKTFNTVCALCTINDRHKNYRNPFTPLNI